MGESKLRVAVVGCGHLGAYHAEKYALMPCSQLVALCDLEITKAEKLAKKFATNSFRDFRELKDLNLDCVSIASDTKSHFEIAKFFIENEVDVLVEKPITATLAEAEILVALANKNRRILQVGHVERFNPAIVRMKDLLKGPWFFEIRRIAPFKGRGADVDVILDLMIHDIDLLLYFVDRPIIKIEAVGIPVLTGAIDIANVRIEFAGGVIANINTSRAAFTSERSFRVFQPNSYLSLDLDAKKIKISTKGEGTSIFGVPNIVQNVEKLNSRDALKDQIESFLSCVSSRNTPLVSGQDGLNAIRIVDKIRESMKLSAQKFGDLPLEVQKVFNQ